VERLSRVKADHPALQNHVLETVFEDIPDVGAIDQEVIFVPSQRGNRQAAADPLPVFLKRKDDSHIDGDIGRKLLRIDVRAEPEGAVHRNLEFPAAEHARRTPFVIPFEQREVERIGENPVVVFLSELGEPRAVNLDQSLLLRSLEVPDPAGRADGVKGDVIVLLEAVSVKFRRSACQGQKQKKHSNRDFHILNSFPVAGYRQIFSPESAQPRG